jgi:hypothetical protein
MTLASTNYFDLDLDSVYVISYYPMLQYLCNCFYVNVLDADCVLVAVLSHGEMGILYASDQPYKPDRLWGHFNAEKCPTLAGKPKLFFVQVSETEIVPKIVTEISPKNQP